MSTPSRGPSRFLVTGGAGFIGHRTASHLLRNDPSVEVAIYDNLSVGMPMPAAGERLATFAADIRDRASLDAAVANFRPDTIIHLAAVHHIPTCEQKRTYALEVNVIGTETVLDVAEHRGVANLVLASSGAVYDWREAVLTEDLTPLRAADNYSLAKLTNERQVAFWAERTGGRVRIARIFNTIGHDDPNAHLVPDIIEQIPRGQSSVEIALGNLTPRRDYIHADDTSAAIALLARSRGGPSLDAFNVSSGKDVSVAELVALLGQVMGVAIAVREDPTRKRRVDRPSQLGDTSKIARELGFQPQKSLGIVLTDIARHLGRLPAGTP